MVINSTAENPCRQVMKNYIIMNELEQIFSPCTPELLVEVPNPDPDDSTAEALVTTFSAH